MPIKAFIQSYAIFFFTILPNSKIKQI